MKYTDDINPIVGLLILFMCCGVSFSLLVLIFKPIADGLNIAWFNVISGSSILILLTYIYINNIFYKQKELEEKEKRKTWIDRVCEKGF